MKNIKNKKSIKNMKSKGLFIALFAMVLIFISCEEEYVLDLDRPSAPMDLVISQGDTAVFLSWSTVDKASSYVVIKGLGIISEDLQSTEFVDLFGPDEPIEYRVYAVNDEGWRSVEYAKGSGYVAIPEGLLPRPPAEVTVSDDNFVGAEITWNTGKFAESYNVYRGDVLLAENLKGNTYYDEEATVDIAEYKVYSVNYNGVSIDYSSALGSKAFIFIDTYEDEAVGFEIPAYTFRDHLGEGFGIAYYTEGIPTVTDRDGYESDQSLEIIAGKAQLLLDWGAIPVAGIYKISVQVKRTGGGFWMVPSFSGAQHIDATGDWTLFEIETAVLSLGEKFNLKIEPHGDGASLIDNWSIEYVGAE